MPIYNLVILLYGFVIRLASWRKLKAKQWVQGRKNWKERYATELAKLGSDKRIWIHCASYGEFEQGRPLIQAIREKHPDFKIALSFFSPSGYEAFKEWSGADFTCYLPLDTKRNAADFVKLVQPHAVIFIKYEFWLNFLNELKKNNIRTFLVSAVFKARHPFFKWYGAIFRRSLRTFHTLFVQDKQSANLLEKIGVRNVHVSGDTRFDRVLEIKRKFSPLPFFETFCKGRKVIVGGSTWPSDEELLLEGFLKIKNDSLRLIIVPHEPNEDHVARLKNSLAEKNLVYALYSSGDAAPHAEILVVDAMGLLSRIYYYADLAYVGGGFDEGIHNTLEPAVYGLPVAFYGESFRSFNEAVELVHKGAAKNVIGAEDLSVVFQEWLHNETERALIRKKLEAYFAERGNAVGRVLAEMEPL